MSEVPLYIAFFQLNIPLSRYTPVNFGAIMQTVSQLWRFLVLRNKCMMGSCTRCAEID